MGMSASGKKQALISLSDKKDLASLGNGLQELGYTIVSTGGNASTLENAGVSVTKVEMLTHFPEMLDGRVKTLHPNIHGGILARRDVEHHMEALNEHGIGTFDVVVVNLYPFYDKVTAPGGISFEDGIENIDIGGPAMIRAAAKNHKDVLIVVDSEDYQAVVYKGGQSDQQFRKKLAYMFSSTGNRSHQLRSHRSSHSTHRNSQRTRHRNSNLTIHLSKLCFMFEIIHFGYFVSCS